MKVDVGEPSGAPEAAVADERQIHQGYTINDTELGRSGANRAVAVAQEHQADGTSGASGSVDGAGTTGVEAAVLGVGLPLRNGGLPGAGDGGAAAAVALQQHGGNSVVDGRALVGSDEYRQVGDFDILIIACCLPFLVICMSCLETVAGHYGGDELARRSPEIRDPVGPCVFGCCGGRVGNLSTALCVLPS